MIIEISSDALIDLEEGFDFYQRQSQGLGAYFISCLMTDIEALTYFGGIHQVVNGYHRALSKRFPFCIYYDIKGEILTVVAVLVMLAEILSGYGRDWADQSAGPIAMASKRFR